MMINTFTKTIAVALATMGLSVALVASPATAADGRHGAFAAGMIGGLAIGALAAGANTPVYVRAYPDCWVESRPVYYGGLFAGYRRVRVCD
jgi:hypothetical protein